MLIWVFVGEEYVSFYVDCVFVVQVFWVYYDVIVVYVVLLYIVVIKVLDDFCIVEGCSVVLILILVSGVSFILKIREFVFFDVIVVSIYF